MAGVPPDRSAGQLLRDWRTRRSVSQLALASGAAVSTRHLSSIETGKSRPSREMLLHLAERLDVPLRERNRLLLAGGYAPVYGERGLETDELSAARSALERFLSAHEPYPALVTDRRWDVVLSNHAVALLLTEVAPDLLRPPVNALRVTLHPDGMAPAIVNFAEWAGHLLDRLDRAIEATGEAFLEDLRAEALSYPGVRDAAGRADRSLAADILLPLQLRGPAGLLSLFATQTVFGTPTDVTLAELSVEAFYPADEATAAALSAAAASARPVKEAV